jgi:hypothetical protein
MPHAYFDYLFAISIAVVFMKEHGVNCVRVFISYGSFYNEPGVLNTNGLAKFDEFPAIAEEHGIYVHPTGPARGAPQLDWDLASTSTKAGNDFRAQYREWLQTNRGTVIR